MRFERASSVAGRACNAQGRDTAAAGSSEAGPYGGHLQVRGLPLISAVSRRGPTAGPIRAGFSCLRGGPEGRVPCG